MERYERYETRTGLCHEDGTASQWIAYKLQRLMLLICCCRCTSLRFSEVVGPPVELFDSKIDIQPPVFLKRLMACAD